MEFSDFSISKTELGEYAVIKDNLIIETFETEQEAKAFIIGFEMSARSNYERD